jgi:hypothetical protein
VTWLGLLVDALVSLVYRANRESERDERQREDQLIRDIAESDALMAEELAKLKKADEGSRP